MAYESLQVLIGTAVIDSDFCKALLNGSRRGAVQSLALSHEELDAVLAIHAETLEQFAGQLDQWIMNRRGQVEPPAVELLIRPRLGREEIMNSSRETAQVSQGALASLPAA